MLGALIHPRQNSPQRALGGIDSHLRLGGGPFLWPICHRVGSHHELREEEGTGLPVWFSISPQGALGELGNHLRIEGVGDTMEPVHSSRPQVWYLTGSVSDGSRIRWVWN
jgi:hypothetical protein